MTTIVVTPETVSLLGPLKEIAELRDAEGHCLGIFKPQALAEEEQRERLKSLFDLEEAERL